MSVALSGFERDLLADSRDIESAERDDEDCARDVQASGRDATAVTRDRAAGHRDHQFRARIRAWIDPALDPTQTAALREEMRDLLTRAGLDRRAAGADRRSS